MPVAVTVQEEVEQEQPGPDGKTQSCCTEGGQVLWLVHVEWNPVGKMLKSNGTEETSESKRNQQPDRLDDDAGLRQRLVIIRNHQDSDSIASLNHHMFDVEGQSW